MLATALRPRFLALLVLVLLAATGMSLLGRWQLERAREHGEDRARRQAASAAARPLEQVIQPRQTFPRAGVGARVTATGQYDAGRRFLIAGRDLAGRSGFWVLVPLRLPGGAAVGVVRGWVPSASDPAAVPTGTPAGAVTVTGLLQPTEPRDTTLRPGQGTGLPAGQLRQISVTDLVNAWPYPLITGYVLAESERDAAGGAVAGPAITRAPPPAVPTGLDWRNLAYALQWWLFAAFGLFLWGRLVRDEHLAQTSAARPDDSPRTDQPADQPQGAST